MILVQYVSGTVVVLGVLALLAIGTQTVLRRIVANRAVRDRMTVNSNSEQARREMAFREKLDASHRRDEWEMDRLGQAAYDKHLEDDGLLDPDQPTISSSFRRAA